MGVAQSSYLDDRYQPVLIEDKINSFATEDTEIGDIIAECKNILVQNPNCGVDFVKRHANIFAHLLARRATDHARLKGFHYIPSRIMNEMS